jgi:LmbE family N-acetylglucosaminyl deacetylase
MFYPDMADEGYHPHKIKYLYVHGHDQPDLKIDITDDLQAKIEAILCHTSQFADPAAAQKRWLELWAEVQPDGSRHYYELFKVMKFG